MAAISNLVFEDGCFQQIIRSLPDGSLCLENSKVENMKSIGYIPAALVPLLKIQRQ